MKWNKIIGLFVSRTVSGRDLAVDGFRGLAIILMIMVNHWPPTNYRYAMFRHAEMTGWSVADTIFPAFLFLVGISIALARKPDCNGATAVPYVRIFRRTFLLMFLSMVLINFPYYEIERFKIHGTLFRIGVCYLIVALMFYLTSRKTQLALILGLLGAQVALFAYLRIPDVPPGTFTAGTNASNYLDALVFGDFASRFVVNTPATQGIAPTAGAVATTLIGLLTGHYVKRTASMMERVTGLFASGFLLTIIGSIVSVVVPISKPVWSPSYVVFMAGISLQVLAVFYWLIDLRGHGKWFEWLKIAGVNALFFYVFAAGFQRLLVYGRIYNADGSATRLRYFVYENWFAPLLPGKPGALLYALCFLAIVYSVVFFLYRRRIYIKL